MKDQSNIKGMDSKLINIRNNKKTPCLIKGNEQDKRLEILEYFHLTYDLHEKLYQNFTTDQGFYTKGCLLRHPIIFYFGHTATFYINKLILGRFIPERVNPKFESLFAIGVDEMSWDDLDETNYEWPSVEAVKEYRDKVRNLVDEYIKSVKFKIPIDWDSAMWPIVMGIEHERIHIETSSVLIRQLPLQFVKQNDDWKICMEDNLIEDNILIDVSGKLVKLGIDHPSEYYGWDNEYGVYEENVKDFKASKMLVSNKEYLEFVEDGGYETDIYWTEEGVNWKKFCNASHPEFWVKTNIDNQKGYKYYLRTMLKEIEMQWSWPVEVNFLEAKAFCNWKSNKIKKNIRLPTEAEYYVLRTTYPYNYPNWKDGEVSGNIDLEYFASSCPVNKYKHGDFNDLFGNVWQWTETDIFAFKNFKSHHVYDDFSTPTFDTRHNIMKGGSWISTGNEALTHSRYAFRRHFFQHAGFRYVESNYEIKIKRNIYEDDEMVNIYLAFHYGESYFDVENYPKNIAQISIQAYNNFGKGKKGKAFDIGCGVGRTSFELAKEFSEVIGLDFSANFIKETDQLKNSGKIFYKVKEEGDICTHFEKSLQDIGITIEEASRCTFVQGDACNLKTNLTGFDLVVACNLIDRLYNPSLFLKEIANRINKGGILIISDPYTWLESYTDKKFWVGGLVENGKELSTIEGLRKILSESFEEVSDPIEVPFVIKETRRKFQYSFSEASFWRKK